MRCSLQSGSCRLTDHVSQTSIATPVVPLPHVPLLAGIAPSAPSEAGYFYTVEWLPAHSLFSSFLQVSLLASLWIGQGEQALHALLSTGRLPGPSLFKVQAGRPAYEEAAEAIHFRDYFSRVSHQVSVSSL